MKEKIILFILTVFPVLLFAQEGATIQADLELGQEFQLKKTSVKFLQVISDSRCPRQVTCIWQGEAKVLLGISVGNDYFEKEFVVSGSGAEFGLTEDFKMLVSQLRPYPETAKGIAPEEYCLNFAAVSVNED